MEMNTLKRQMRWVGTIGCIVLATACRQSSQNQSVVGNYETMKVSASDAELTTAYSATIRGRQDIDIYPQVSGTIQELCVTEGEKVSQGQPL